MTCLSTLQTVCNRVGLNSPTYVIGNTDPQIQQLLALLNEEGEDLAQRTAWQSLTHEASFTTVATEIQGAVSTIAPGLKYIINDTIWNRDLRRPVYGPLAAQRWQQLKAMAMQGPFNQFRVRGDDILFIPTPSAGQSCYFEYVSKYWLTDTSGTTSRSAFASDDDVSVLDESLLILGTIWRWKAMKGFDFTIDQEKYEERVMNAIARDGSKDWLNLADNRFDILPAILVPSGSWNL